MIAMYPSFFLLWKRTIWKAFAYPRFYRVEGLVSWDRYVVMSPLDGAFASGSLCFYFLFQMGEAMRPFMGPNLYLTPGGSFTCFHQDGQGTVDSGHSCIKGYNEVVMLRRLPEAEKFSAMNYHRLNPLHNLPHDQGEVCRCSIGCYCHFEKGHSHF